MTDRSNAEGIERAPLDPMKKEWKTPRMEELDVAVHTQNGFNPVDDGNFIGS